MKSRDKTAVSTLRMLSSTLKNKEIETRAPLTDDDVLRLIQTGIKQRREAMVQYEEGGRADLVEQEKAEAEVLERYLPSQLSEAELESVVEAAISQVGATSIKDMGQVMKQVLAQVAGRADGGAVNAKVREKLA